MRFVIRDVDEDLVALCCPICGFEYVHPERVVVEQGRTRTQVTNETTQVTAIDNAYRRGSLIVLHFHCENGHGFEYRLEFCKGYVFCELSTSEIGDMETREELWRN